MTHPPFVVRTLGPGDAPRLASFAARLFRETYAPTHPAADIDAYVAESFGPAVQRAELEAPGAVTLAIVRADAPDDAGALAAYAQLRADPAPREVGSARAMEIARFYVDRPWHGAGLAPTLMRAALRTAHERGADTMWLGVWSGNARAIAFYRRMGFAIVGAQTFRFGSILDQDHVMARPLVPDDAGA